MSEKIIINVGGKNFFTTLDTINQCSKLAKYFKINNKKENKNEPKKVFIDRDPTVFGRLLKFLRGYPIDNILKDDELVYELIYWNHSFNDLKLCNKCLIPTSQSDLIFPNSETVDNLNKTHIIISETYKNFIQQSQLIDLKNDGAHCALCVCDTIFSDMKYYWIEKSVYTQFIRLLKLKCFINKQFSCFCKN